MQMMKKKKKELISKRRNLREDLLKFKNNFKEKFLLACFVEKAIWRKKVVKINLKWKNTSRR